jgi:hypothetical protein
VLATTFFSGATAQEFSTSLDIYSSYIWRGAKFGSGPAFQPGVEFSAGGFALGAWGSVNASDDEALEMDLYVSYSIGDLSITVTDYYFGGNAWLDFEGAHSIEPSLGYSLGNLSLTAAAMFMPMTEASAKIDAVPAMVDLETGVFTSAIDAADAVEAAGFGEAIDLYFEAAYSFGDFDLTVGAGNGQYTSDGEFMVCNVGIGTSKEIKITDSFSLPVSGAVIMNPSTEGFFVTVGVSF